MAKVVKKVIGTSDTKTDAKFKKEKTYWTDLLEVKEQVTGQLAINLEVCSQVGIQNKEFFNTDKEAGKLLVGISKSLADAATELNGLAKRIDENLYTDETKTVKKEKSKLVVKPKDELAYMAIYMGYTENAEVIGKLGLDLMIGLSTKINCADIANEGVNIVNNFNTATDTIENTVQQKVGE